MILFYDKYRPNHLAKMIRLSAPLQPIMISIISKHSWFSAKICIFSYSCLSCGQYRKYVDNTPLLFASNKVAHLERVSNNK